MEKCCWCSVLTCTLTEVAIMTLFNFATTGIQVVKNVFVKEKIFLSRNQVLSLGKLALYLHSANHSHAHVSWVRSYQHTYPPMAWYRTTFMSLEPCSLLASPYLCLCGPVGLIEDQLPTQRSVFSELIMSHAWNWLTTHLSTYMQPRMDTQKWSTITCSKPVSFYLNPHCLCWRCATVVFTDLLEHHCWL